MGKGLKKRDFEMERVEQRIFEKNNFNIIVKHNEIWKIMRDILGIEVDRWSEIIHVSGE